MKLLTRNGLDLPINDAHVYQRRGVIIAHQGKEPLHFTILRCKEGLKTKVYFGAARVDNLEDFKRIIDYGDKFEPINQWYTSHHKHL